MKQIEKNIFTNVRSSLYVLDNILQMKKILFGLLLFPFFANGQIITTIAGNGIAGSSGDGGLAVNASFEPTGVTFDNHGNLLICNFDSYTIKKLDTLTGILTLFAGDSLGGTALGDGGLAIYAHFNPLCICVDSNDNVYIGDEQLSGVRVRKVDAVTGIITTIAGNGTVGYGGDGGIATSAAFSNAAALCIDNFGNLYISDTWNHRIRKVNLSTGTITTYAGIGVAGYSGDGGPATSAKITEPDGICLDHSGNLYIGDRANGRIRKVDAVTGIITTFAGNGIIGFGGDGGNADSAEFDYMLGMTVDTNNNLYFTDANNNRVRRIDAITHIVTTVAGNGPECPPPSAGGCGTFGGDGGPADSGYLHQPFGLCLDHSRNIYIGDCQNMRVRKVGYGVITPTFNGGAIQPLNLCIGAGAIAIDTLMAITDVLASGTEKWTVISAPSHGILGGFSATATCTGGYVIPSGLTYTPASGFTGTDVFSIQINNGQDSTITTVNVSMQPVPAAISGDTVICLGHSTALNSSPAGGVWSSSDAYIAPVVFASGEVSGIAAGASIITYALAPGCIATRYVIVNPLPAAITGDTSVCLGFTTILDDAGGGVWSSGNATIASVNTASGMVSGISVANTTITYTLPTGCFVTTGLTVNPLPPVILGDTTVCSGLTTTLSDVYDGVWSSSNTSIASIGTSSGIVTGGEPGITTITYTLPTGCAATSHLTVKLSPPAISGDTTICRGSTTILGDFGGGTWSSNNAAIASINASSGVVTGISVAGTTITYTLPSGCFATKNITVNLSPPSITGDSMICAGTTMLLSDPYGGTWSSSSIVIASIGTSTGFITGEEPGTATITYMLPTGCIATMHVTVNPLPAAITGDTTLCQGSTTTLNNTGSGVWSSSNNAAASINPSTGVVTGLSVADATITYSLPTGCFTTSTITVNPLPPVILGDTTLCSGEMSTLNDVYDGVWSSSNTSIASITAGTGVVTGGEPGTVTITYTLPTGCIATTDLTVVRCVTAVPEVINNNIKDLYPNPVSSILTIAATEKISDIVIADLLGQTVYKQNCDVSQVQVDVTSLSSGIYFVKINGAEVKKFIKE